mmetsp:Transcript_5031/g.20102  ORF Transcript_5031/g.20102 Transcript_5031/m.20102 type:complete len:209 (-) Transcript_5031:382-1008(-)
MSATNAARSRAQDIPPRPSGANRRRPRADPPKKDPALAHSVPLALRTSEDGLLDLLEPVPFAPLARPASVVPSEASTVESPAVSESSSEDSELRARESRMFESRLRSAKALSSLSEALQAREGEARSLPMPLRQPSACSLCADYEQKASEMYDRIRRSSFGECCRLGPSPEEENRQRQNALRELDLPLGDGRAGERPDGDGLMFDMDI